jgi:hypothetical protein
MRTEFKSLNAFFQIAGGRCVDKNGKKYPLLSFDRYVKNKNKL